MTDSTVSKFTKLLPLSIRKEGGGSGSGGGGGHQQQQHHHGFFGNHQDASNSSSVGSGLLIHTEQKEMVRITLCYPSAACGAMNPHKEITMRLTNDENPAFFYHLKITEGDFPELKAQQGLLVDFYGFPNQLVTLLEKCDPAYNGMADGSSSLGSDSAGPFGVGSCGPKFVLVMKIGNNLAGISSVMWLSRILDRNEFVANAGLDIVESNPFKYLCHLSLQINAGTDAEVKKYLCDVTTGLKKDGQLLREKYNHLASTMEDETTRLKAQLEQRASELGELRDQLHAQANSLSTKHFQDMTQEKEKLLKLQSELATKFEVEKSDLDRRHCQVDWRG
jgi:spindle assembly abnormal protein 6